MGSVPEAEHHRVLDSNCAFLPSCRDDPGLTHTLITPLDVVKCNMVRARHRVECLIQHQRGY
jgi:hypothetical protein